METKEFFGKDGLTQTSANHIANLAKEYYQRLEADTRNISAFNQTAVIIGGESLVIHKGTTHEEFSNIESTLNKISECKGLIAYLREAIKERELIYKQILGYIDNDARLCLSNPVRDKGITKDEVMQKWSIGDLLRYYRLDAECATLGKYIHPDGNFNLLRKTYYETLKNPIELSGKGKDLIATHNDPTLTSEEIENLFFELQDKWRTAQAELNGINHSIDQEMEKDSIEKLNKYNQEYLKYTAELEKIEIAEEQKRNEMLQEFQKLRIVIPNAFQSIYKEILSLSKK